MKPVALLLALLLVPLAAPPAGADAKACSKGALAPAAAWSRPAFIQGALSFFEPTEGCNGTLFRSHAEACPAGHVGPLPGAFCGAHVSAKPGAAVTCFFDPLGPAAASTVLVIGWDLNGDGHVREEDGESATAPSPLLVPGAWTVANPHGVPTLYVAYPTSTTGAKAPEHTSWLGCTAT